MAGINKAILALAGWEGLRRRHILRMETQLQRQSTQLRFFWLYQGIYHRLVILFVKGSGNARNLQVLKFPEKYWV